MNKIADSYISEIQSISAEITRLNGELRNLREQKLKAQNHLLHRLKEMKVDEYKGYKISKLTPKERTKPKKKKEKLRDGIAYLRELGAPDPESAYMAIMSTQKPQKKTDEQYH